MSNVEILKTAINNKSCIRCSYTGHVREMCPHVLGFKNGTTHLLSYQYAGTSSSGPIISQSDENWRCMDVDRIQAIELIEGDWESHSPHTQDQTCVDEVIAEVQY